MKSVNPPISDCIGLSASERPCSALGHESIWCISAEHHESLQSERELIAASSANSVKTSETGKSPETAVLRVLLKYCSATVQSLGRSADGEESLAETAGLQAGLLEDGAVQSDG